MSALRDLIEDLKSPLAESKIPRMTKFVDTWETDDYPSGRHRVKAIWTVERKGGKARVARITHHPKTGRPSKPKRTTYGSHAKIGIGADGRAYIVQFSEYGQIIVTPGTMKYPTYLHDKDPGYEELRTAIGASRQSGNWFA
jgi:hypothetical protein